MDNFYFKGKFISLPQNILCEVKWAPILGKILLQWNIQNGFAGKPEFSGFHALLGRKEGTLEIQNPLEILWW